VPVSADVRTCFLEGLALLVALVPSADCFSLRAERLWLSSSFTIPALTASSLSAVTISEIEALVLSRLLGSI
jgi:hypothetical protein